MIMKTTIKYVARDMYKDSVLEKVIYTGKIKVCVSNDVDVIQRNVDDDGVVEFTKGLSKTFKMKSGAFNAQIRNNVSDSWSGMLSYFLDANKALTEDNYYAQLNVVLSGAEIELASELKESDDDSDDSREVYFYTISNIELTSMAKLVIGSKFCRECLFMTDMNDIKSFISTLE
jgi:hypothetical protein